MLVACSLRFPGLAYRLEEDERSLVAPYVVDGVEYFFTSHGSEALDAESASSQSKASLPWINNGED
jgi:hypothetical protein